jgi:hypothetical protein
VQIVLAGLRPELRRVLELTKLDKVFALQPTRQAALEQLGGGRARVLVSESTRGRGCRKGARSYSAACKLLLPVGNAAALEVVGGDFDRHVVAGEDADEVFAHAAGDMGQYFVLGGADFGLDQEHGIWEGLYDDCFKLDASALAKKAPFGV